MNQLGGIRFTACVDRASRTAGYRFGFRTLPAARRSRRRCAVFEIVFVLLSVASVVGSLSAGKTIGDAMDGVVGFGIFVLAGCVGASSRFRAWSGSRQVSKDLLDEHTVMCRFDESGYATSGAGRSTGFDWSVITAVAEGDSFMALEVGRNVLVTASIEQLTDAERTTIRRWAEAAPNGPRWDVRRSAGDSPRLRVSPFPSSDLVDQTSIATTDPVVEVTPVSGESRA